MRILTEIQNKRLGLIELLSMGFDIYLKNLKSISVIFLVTVFPFQLFLSMFIAIQENGIVISGIYLALFFIIYIGFIIPVMVYYIAISILVEQLIHEQKTNYGNIIKIIISRLIPLTILTIKFSINFYLRFLLLFIPGLIYFVNNGYYGLAFILRDQRGKAAFAYSRAIVKGNWWRVFFFGILVFFVNFSSQILLTKLLDFIPFIHSFFIPIVSILLSSIIAIGPAIGGSLLFFNLDYYKGLLPSQEKITNLR